MYEYEHENREMGLTNAEMRQCLKEHLEEQKKENDFNFLCQQEVYSKFLYMKITSNKNLDLIKIGEEFILKNITGTDFILIDVLKNFQVIYDTRCGDKNKIYFETEPFFQATNPAIMIVRSVNNGYYLPETSIIIYQNALEDNLARYVLTYSIMNEKFTEEFISTNSKNSRCNELEKNKVEYDLKIKYGDKYFVLNHIIISNIYGFFEKNIFSNWSIKYSFLSHYLWDKYKNLLEYRDYFLTFVRLVDYFDMIFKNENPTNLDSKIIQAINTINYFEAETILDEYHIEEEKYLSPEDKLFGYNASQYF